ncbi:NADPH-dependent F420 reductase [Bifidobacterium eulemuris]|uniref:NADPH-dependent F420 reductase n=1 Tax=Bifidobacterium eulemuris TaxID=1765219 RepID=A0A7L9SSR4_9BIFI|nr:NADPH-dependent F420 reductase [Bifidobacterium eulemuris]
MTRQATANTREDNTDERPPQTARPHNTKEVTMTNVTIIGAGNIGSAVAGIAAKAGAAVQIINRDLEKARAAAPDGATVAAYGEPITGDIVVLALPYPALADVAERYADQLDGKVVVDPSNPIDFSTFDSVVPAEYASGAAEFAAKVPGAQVVKAFNTDFAAVLASGQTDGAPTTVLVAGDHDAANQAVINLVNAAGLRGVNVLGGLKRAKELEAMGSLQIILAVTEATPWTGGFKIVK